MGTAVGGHVLDDPDGRGPHNPVATVIDFLTVRCDTSVGRVTTTAAPIWGKRLARLEILSVPGARSMRRNSSGPHAVSLRNSRRAAASALARHTKSPSCVEAFHWTGASSPGSR